MSEDVIVQIKDDLTCPICTKTFCNPCILPCLHSFCKDCITRSESNPKGKTAPPVTCPECNQVCVTNGDLKENVFISGLLALNHLKAERREPCTVCFVKNETNTASFRCLHCGDCLCSKCEKNHKYSSLTISHKVVPLKELHSGKHDAELRNLQQVSCKTHSGELLQYYCNPCGTLVCRDCAVLEHNGHTCVKPTEALKSKIPSLGNMMAMLESKVELATRSLTSIEEAMKSLGAEEKESKACIQFLTEFLTDTLMNKIIKETQNTLNVVEGAIQAKRTFVAIRQRENDLNLRIMANTLDFCQKVLRNGNALEILFLEDLLCKRLNHVNKTEVRDLTPEILNMMHSFKQPTVTPGPIFSRQDSLGLFVLDGEDGHELKDVATNTISLPVCVKSDKTVATEEAKTKAKSIQTNSLQVKLKQTQTDRKLDMNATPVYFEQGSLLLQRASQKRHTDKDKIVSENNDISDISVSPHISFDISDHRYPHSPDIFDQSPKMATANRAGPDCIPIVVNKPDCTAVIVNMRHIAFYMFVLIFLTVFNDGHGTALGIILSSTVLFVTLGTDIETARLHEKRNDLHFD